VNILKEMVRNVSVIVLINLFLSLIVPAGELSRFIRMVMGLLLIAAMLNPIVQIVSGKNFQPIYSATDYQDNTATMLSEGERVAGQLQAAAKKDYDTELARQVEALCNLVAGVGEAGVILESEEQTGVIEKIIIDVTQEPDAVAEFLENKIRSTIANFFGIENEVIHISISIGEPEREVKK
jgi:stage III sporulation protein AF